MLGTDNTSEALWWCIKAAWAAHGDKIKETCGQEEIGLTNKIVKIKTF
jgi:hypothetical protein